MDKGKVDQLKKEIRGMREGQKQAQEQWKQIEEKIIHQQENNKQGDINEEDLIKVARCL